MSRGLGRLQIYLLRSLYHCRLEEDDAHLWVDVRYIRIHERLDGVSATARHRANRASVRRGVRRLEDVGLVESQLRDTGVRQIDRHGESHPPRHRLVMFARLTPQGISYVRSHDIDPEYTKLRRLLAVIDSYGRGGPAIPEQVRSRFREGTRLLLTERLFTPTQASHHLLREGFELSVIEHEIERWQLQMWDLSTPTDRAYELLFTYEHIEILTMWLQARPDVQRH